MMKVYKYRSELHRDLLCLVNNEIYAPSAVELNDPCECFFDTTYLCEVFAECAEDIANRRVPPGGQEKWDNIVNDVKNNFGIISFSQSCDDELMWAYYSDEHRGFCIEYDIDKIIKHLSLDYDLKVNVCYQETPPEINNGYYSDIFDNQKIIQFFHGTKSKSWKHENEIRLVLTQKQLIPIPPDAVTGIYFGLRASDDDKKMIMKTLYGRDITFYQMHPIVGTYKIEPKPIE